MADPMDEARAAVANLADTDEDDLYRLLALRMKTLERDPAIAGQFAPPTMAATELGIAMPDLHALGRKLFENIARSGQSIICGSDSEAGFHLQRLLSSVNMDITTVTAGVATLLVGQLAIAPAVAGIVAAIVVGKVAPNSVEALCAAWTKKLGPVPVPGTGTLEPGTGAPEPTAVPPTAAPPATA
jgi:hypothetical protein